MYNFQNRYLISQKQSNHKMRNLMATDFRFGIRMGQLYKLLYLTFSISSSSTVNSWPLAKIRSFTLVPSWCNLMAEVNPLRWTNQTASALGALHACSSANCSSVLAWNEKKNLLWFVILIITIHINYYGCKTF